MLYEVITLLSMALNEATIVPRSGADGIAGAALEQLAREYLLAESVINRLGHLIDSDVLHALIDSNIEVDRNNFV